ncbi:MAG: CotH kinase family protein [Bacteroidales bacterium]|nr:CotH kinase family protein [Bacteroidales bacterium]
MKIYIVLSLLVLLCLQLNAQNDKNKIGDKFYNTDLVHDIHIKFAHCNYWDSLIHYKEHYKDKLEINKYLQANVTIDGKTFYAVGVRIKGESSYDYTPGNKKSFKIKFNKFIKKQDLDNLSTINLNNGFKDPSFLREKIFFDILKSEGIPAPRISFTNLNINDKNYGLYVVSEHINSRFLEKYFGNKNGSFYKGEPKATFEYLGNKTDNYQGKFHAEHKKNKIRKDLVDLIKIINDDSLSETEFKEEIEQVLNVENCLRIFAITNIFCNVDAYNMIYPHNFYLYKNTDTDLFEWIPYDANYAFCAWSPVFELREAEKMSIFYQHPDNNNPLFQKIISNSYYRDDYISYMQSLLDKYFTNEYIENMIDDLSLKIRKSVYLDTMKMYSNDEFEKNLNETIGDPDDPGAFIPGLKSFWIKRRKAVKAEIKKLNRD